MLYSLFRAKFIIFFLGKEGIVVPGVRILKRQLTIYNRLRPEAVY